MNRISFSILLLVFISPILASESDEEKAILHLRNKGVMVSYQNLPKYIWLKPDKGDKKIPVLRARFDGYSWKPCFEDVEALLQMPHLKSVAFDLEDFDEDWLRILPKLPQLREVVLNGAVFTDKSTQYLKNVRKLDTLSLFGTSITDKGIANLDELEQLDFVSLVWTRGISEKGLSSLKLSRLRFLNLDGTATKSIGFLKQSTKLEWLKCNPSKPELGVLNRMTKLRSLYIGGMPTTEKEMNVLLNQARDLASIETNSGIFSRAGWRETENLPEKLKKLKEHLGK